MRGWGGLSSRSCRSRWLGRLLRLGLGLRLKLKLKAFRKLQGRKFRCTPVKCLVDAFPLFLRLLTLFVVFVAVGS